MHPALVFRCVMPPPVPMWAAAGSSSGSCCSLMFWPLHQHVAGLGGVVAFGDISPPHPAAPLKFFSPFNPYPTSEATASSWPSHGSSHSSPQTRPHQLLPLCPVTCLWLLDVYLDFLTWFYGRMMFLHWGTPPLQGFLAAFRHPSTVESCSAEVATVLWTPLSCLRSGRLLFCLPSTHHLPLMTV